MISLQGLYFDNSMLSLYRDYHTIVHSISPCKDTNTIDNSMIVPYRDTLTNIRFSPCTGTNTLTIYDILTGSNSISSCKDIIYFQSISPCTGTNTLSIYDILRGLILWQIYYPCKGTNTLTIYDFLLQGQSYIDKYMISLQGLIP